MKLAISGELLGSSRTLSEIIKTIKMYGVNALELWPENIPLKQGEKLIHKRLYANRDVEKAKSILSQAGVETACVCFGAGFDEKLASDSELFSRELVRAVETAQILGAKIVNHYCVHVAAEEWTNEKLHKYYGAAIQAAENYRIYLSLENEAHDITRNPSQMKKIVKAMDSEYFRTTYDAVNYYQAGYEGFPYAYELLKKELVHVHIKNGCIYAPEFGHETECKGQSMTGKLTGETIYYPVASDGAVNIDGLIRRLKTDGYNGFCTLEPHVDLGQCTKYYEAETAYLKQKGF